MKNKIIANLILIVLLGLTLVACLTPRDSALSEFNNIKTGERSFFAGEVALILYTNNFNIDTLRLTDSKYLAPEKKWVESDFTGKFSKFLFKYNVNHWEQESFDCDKMTRAAAFYAGVLFNNSPNRIKAHGFLVGEIYYYKTGKGRHAINICIVKDGQDYRIMLYDPQLKFEVTISPEEKSSAFLIKI